MAKVIVFVRAPVLGVKRRLAGGIGAVAARRVYVELSTAILRRLAMEKCWQVSVAATPDNFVRRGRSWPRRIARFPQGQGDLGARMQRALVESDSGPVILVGSDIADLTPGHIRCAFAALAERDIVFGPAADGGYWLVGVKEPRLARGLFRNVRWSSPHALADTRRNVPSHRRVALIDTLEDIDDAESLRRWRAKTAALRRARASGAPAGGA